MAFNVENVADFIVPDGKMLVFLSGDSVFAKDAAGAQHEVDSDDMIRMNLTVADLPMLIPASLYSIAHSYPAMQNIDMSSAFGRSAAAKYTKMVSEAKASKAELATAEYKLEQKIVASNGDVAAEVARATAAEAELKAGLDTEVADRKQAIKDLDATINMGTIIDRIWIYPDGIVDLSLMVKTGMYFCSANAAVVGTPNVGMPAGAAEGCIMVLENGQIFVDGLTGRCYYRHQDDAGNVVTQYTQDWIAGALLSDVEKHIAEVNEKFLSYTTDYTAFEVLATDEDITAGTVDDVTGLTYKFEVPASMKAAFVLRTNCQTADSDVIVDFGDGTRIAVKDVEASSTQADGTELNVYVEHTYAQPGRYIVKFFGKEYFGFTTTFNGKGVTSIVSRLFASDLPVASHIKVAGAMAMWSRRLLKINIPAYEMSAGLFNLATFLQEAVNLVELTGAKYLQASVRNCNTMLKKCYALKTTDFIIPGYIRDGAIREIFAECGSLSANISKLIPAGGFVGDTYDVYRAFFKCANLTGTVPAAKLWENTKITWKNTSETFAGCSDAIRAQVPTSWGGTNEEIEAKLQSGFYKLAIKGDLDAIEADASSTIGSEAIVVDGAGVAKTVSLKLDGSTLSQSDAGLKSVIKIQKQSEAEEGFAATYFLADGNGVEIADSVKINIIKDQFLKSAELVTGDGTEVNGNVLADGEKYLHFVFELTKGSDDTADDTDSHIYISVNDLFDSYTAGNTAIVVNQDNNTISLAIDNSDTVVIGEGESVAVLSIVEGGLKVNGVQKAIDYAVGVEKAARTVAEKAITDRLDVIEGTEAGSITKAAEDAKEAAINAAASDATTKANIAQANAESKAASLDDALYAKVTGDIATAKAGAEAVAAADATAKDNALHEVIAGEIDDAKESVTETASQDATAKANAAQVAAEATASADATAKANAAQAAAEAKAAELDSALHETVKGEIAAAKTEAMDAAADVMDAHAIDALHNPEVLIVREDASLTLEYKQYICKAALTGVLPVAPIDATKRVVSVIAGGEGTVITAGEGDTLNGGTEGLAINFANDTVTFIYDSVEKNWIVL